MDSFEVVPAAVDAEMATLGAILVEPSQLVPVARVVKPRHFHRPSHRIILAKMLDLQRQGITVDITTLGEALKGQPAFKEAGGLSYLIKLVERTPTAVHGPHYAMQVYRAAKRREMIDGAGRLARIAFNDDESFDDLMPKARAILDEIDDHEQNSETGNVEDALLDLIEPRKRGWSTGEPSLDRMLGGVGLVPGKMLVLTGKSGAGKTWLASSMLASAIDEGARVAAFTLEMPRSGMVARIGASRFGPDALRLLAPPDEWSSADQDLCDEIGAWLIGKPVRIFERQFDVHAITTLARIHAAEVVLVDYYQNLRRPADAGRSSADEVDRLLSAALEDLARMPSGPCVLVVSQLNKLDTMKYGAWLNTKCDAHLAMTATESPQGDPLVKIRPEKNRWAPDADSGVEKSYLMDKSRGRLLPYTERQEFDDAVAASHAARTAEIFGGDD